MSFEKIRKTIPLAFLAIAIILPVFFKDSRYYMNMFNLAGIFCYSHL